MVICCHFAAGSRSFDKLYIAGFGGDNGNITIAGHSAGGMAVQLMLVDPRARGLFHRAISDAGYGTWPFPKAANPSPEERARIRYGNLEVNATLAELVRQTPYYHLPYLGGSDLPQQPIDEFRAGKQAPVAYIAGANSLDGRGTINGAGFTTDSFLSRYEDDLAVIWMVFDPQPDPVAGKMSAKMHVLEGLKFAGVEKHPE